MFNIYEMPDIIVNKNRKYRRRDLIKHIMINHKKMFVKTVKVAITVMCKD